MNHALGLVSLDAQEDARPYVMALWHSPPGQILLYGSLIIHAICALASLARRRQYAMPYWEVTQILLGLAIPYLLLVHIVNTRGTRILTGIDINYPYEIANLWVDPWTRFRQILLVAVGLGSLRGRSALLVAHPRVVSARFPRDPARLRPHSNRRRCSALRKSG